MRVPTRGANSSAHDRRLQRLRSTTACRLRSKRGTSATVVKPTWAVDGYGHLSHRYYSLLLFLPYPPDNLAENALPVEGHAGSVRASSSIQPVVAPAWIHCSICGSVGINFGSPTSLGRHPTYQLADGQCDSGWTPSQFRRRDLASARPSLGEQMNGAALNLLHHPSPQPLDWVLQRQRRGVTLFPGFPLQCPLLRRSVQSSLRVPFQSLIRVDGFWDHRRARPAAHG